MAVDTARAQGATRGGGGGGGAPVTPPSASWWTRLVAFYHGVVAEMRKVTWPDRAQVRSATIAIIVFVLLLGLFIFLMDGALQAILLRLIPSLFAGS
jgi:preprotein translocase subunit SecE